MVSLTTPQVGTLVAAESVQIWAQQETPWPQHQPRQGQPQPGRSVSGVRLVTGWKVQQKGSAQGRTQNFPQKIYALLTSVCIHWIHLSLIQTYRLKRNSKQSDLVIHWRTNTRTRNEEARSHRVFLLLTWYRVLPATDYRNLHLQNTIEMQNRQQELSIVLPYAVCSEIEALARK